MTQTQNQEQQEKIRMPRKSWMSSRLMQARKYEKQMENAVAGEERPSFHLGVQIGWMNDPNGFCYYNGYYHMFYQYYPYAAHWDPMHWGHAVSRDLLHWKYMPCAIAPDHRYDKDGCFSGSAILLPDGRHMLMYTGVDKEYVDENGDICDPSGEKGGVLKDIQTQNLAFGDGCDYIKYIDNPVLTCADLPAGADPAHFRDPKMVLYGDGTYRMYAVTYVRDVGGTVVQYISRDGVHWSFKGILDQNNFRIGIMWECPDFFELDGKAVLMCSAQDMLPAGLEYHNGNGTFIMTGSYDDETGKFTEEGDHAVDYGIDFYAPQTILTPDGRRVMIGWMQNWDTVNLRTFEPKWYGQMSIPRELSVKDGRIFQKPIREIETFRRGKISFRNVSLDSSERFLEGIRGRRADIEVTVRAREGEDIYRCFGIRFAQNENLHSEAEYRPEEGTVKIDRKCSGSRRAVVHQRRCDAGTHGGDMKLRLILDRYSAEVFINDGEKVMSMTLITPQTADAISFYAEGMAQFDVDFYTLDRI